MKGALIAITLLGLSTPAAGQTSPAGSSETPQQRQRVIDLAYVLGEAHALHRVCAGSGDNTWRGRMARLLQVEAPDSAFRARLMTSFNAGFVARNAQFATCSDKSAMAERTVAERGRGLARGVAAEALP
jgi:uncharacterized protein (TIGR02301 family)